MVGLGLLFLVASIKVGTKILQVVPEGLRSRWEIIVLLMFFFIAGYLAFLVFQIKNVMFPMEIITGPVFLGGAFFVFLVMSLTRMIIDRIRESEQQLKELNVTLSANNVVLEGEIQARKKAEEQARINLQHISTLHSIDMMIISSMDLRMTLKVLFEQALPELRMDAMDVLILSPHTLTLEYVAGHGFSSQKIKASKERLGEGSAGKAAMDRRLIIIPNLADDEEKLFIRDELIEEEGFAAYYAIPLMAKGHIKGVLELFNRRYFEADSVWFDFLEALAVQAAIAIENATLFDDLQKSNAELVIAYDSTIEGWARALELRDKETEGHTQRVVEITLRLARSYGIKEAELIHVRRGALLHDIGKMAIADSILMKEGTFTDEEQEIMRLHPEHAFKMLSQITYLKPALDIPYCHHEKWDGTGYPRGLKGEQIPIAARIFAVADIYDALRSKRRYHPAWSEEKVIEHLQSLAGSHLDPKLVEMFLGLPREDAAAALYQ